MLIPETVPLSPTGGAGWCIEPSSLQCADIIVTNDNSSWISYIIRLGTLSDVSHALVYINGGQIVEALFKGVVKCSLLKELKDDTLAVAYRHDDMTPSKATQIAGFLRRQAREHKGYDLVGAILSPFGGHGQNASKFFCSELVLAAYQSAGVVISGRPDQAPPSAIVDAVSSHRLRYIGHLKAYLRPVVSLDAMPGEIGDAIRVLKSPQTQQAVAQAFERWQSANRSLTRAMIVGVHKITVTVAVVNALAGLTGNPLASLGAAVLGSPTVLELVIRRMAVHYERTGALTDANRRHFEELVEAVEHAKAHAGGNQRVLVNC